MKKYFILILEIITVFFFISNTFAYDDAITHPEITKQAIRNSSLACDTCTYLLDNLGFQKGLDEIITVDYDATDINKRRGPRTIREVIINGSRMEDSGTLPPDSTCSRGFNHFYDPTAMVTDDNIKAGGLSDWTPWTLSWNVPYISNLKWGTSINCSVRFPSFNPIYGSETRTNYYSWIVARDNFYLALRVTDNTQRNQYFEYMFRSLGQVVHLLQDMAVPAHVRNDMKGHLLYQKIAWPLPNTLGNNYEYYVKTHSGLVQGYAPAGFNKLSDFWDTDNYNGDANITGYSDYGLAEYTQTNFLSDFRMIGAYPHPSKEDGFFDHDNPVYYYDKDEKLDIKFYFKKEQGEPLQHLAAEKYTAKYLPANDPRTHYLDEQCYNEYALKLLPKAIGYSAGLINYFFRGTLGVAEATIIDGDNITIRKIRAKVINTSPNDEQKCEGNVDCTGKEYANNGQVFAFIRYRIAPDAEYSYAVSQQAIDANGSVVTSIGYVSSTEMTFDFSQSNIPGNAQDIYLHVIYYGDLGNEEATGIAIGASEVRDLYVLLNSGDYYTVFSSRTSTVVGNLKNPRYGQKDQYGNLLYPNAREFFRFPEKAVNTNDDFYEYKNTHLKTEDTIELFATANDEGYDNNQEKLFTSVYEPTGEEANLKQVGYACGGRVSDHWFIPSQGDQAEGWSNQYNKFWNLNNYARGAWNKINKHEGDIFSSSYEVTIINDRTNERYTGSWDDNLVDIGCAALLQDPYDVQQCYAMCDCYNNNLGNTTEVVTGDHDDNSSQFVEITTEKYTPLGRLWDRTITDTDQQTRYQGAAYFECTYSIMGVCGIQTNNLCGVSLTTKTSIYDYDWDAPGTVVYGPQQVIHAQTSFYYNSIIGYIHSDSQQVLQIHYHALDIQNKNSSTLIAPEIYVLAQLNRHEGVYDKANDRINFSTQDGRINDFFGPAIKSLIEYSMVNTGTGTIPQGIDASFVLVK